MRKIAILVSGDGKATERIVKLFNEGNRVKTSFVITDDDSTVIREVLDETGVEIIMVNEERLTKEVPQLVEKFKEEDISLLVDDAFIYPIPEELIDAAHGKLLKVDSADHAPREVISVLEEDLRKAREIKKQVERVEPSNPTPEDEWAKALKINFTPPKVPVVPPPIPESREQEVSSGVKIEVNEPYNGYNHQGYNHKPQNHEGGIHEFHRRDEEKQPVMPPTYLIWSILITVFCCFIPGIIAIIFSSQVSSRFYAGDIEGAWQSSRLAEIWIIISVVLGVVAATLFLPFMFLF